MLDKTFFQLFFVLEHSTQESSIRDLNARFLNEILPRGEAKKTTHLTGRKAGDRARWKPSSIVDRQ